MNFEYNPEVAPIAKFQQKAKGRYKIQVMDENGLVRETEWKPNLILDCGLDKIAYMPWAQAFQIAVAGTGTTPTKDDPLSAASQATTLVTLTSGGYNFTTADIGKLIYWPTTNSQARITAFNGASSVTVTPSQTVANGSFLLYRVGQTALTTQVKQHNYYLPGTNFCGHEVTGNVVRLYRTFDFHMEFTSRTYGELGFKESPGATQLFSRIQLNPTQTIRAGQYLRVNYELYVTLSPSTPFSKIAPISGWPVSPSVSLSGSEQIQMIGLCGISSNGVATPIDANAGFCNEPFAPGTTSFGPGWGNVNRWHNSLNYSYTNPATGSNPLKRYDNTDINPFRQLGGPTYEDILPALSAISNSTTVSITVAKAQLGLSPVFNTSLNKIVVSAINSVSNYFWLHSTTGEATNENSKFGFPSNGSSSAPLTGSWHSIRRDFLRPFIEYSSSTGNDTSTSNFLGEDFLYDPYVYFPANVPQPLNQTLAPIWPDWYVNGASVFLSTVSAAHASVGTCVDRSASCYEIPLELVSYTLGSYTRTKYAMFLTDDANGTTWRSLGVGGTDNNLDPTLRINAAKYNGFVFIFDEPQTKQAAYVLQVSFRYTWDRDLTTS